MKKVRKANKWKKSLSSIKKTSIEECVALLEAGKLRSNEVDTHGNTLLHHLAKTHQPNLVKLLIQQGASFEIENANGQTPLQIAIIRRNIECVRFYVNLGAATINTKNGGALITALLTDDPEVFEIILRASGVSANAQIMNNISLIQFAITEGKFTNTHFLLTNGANVNQKNENNETLIHLAIQYLPEAVGLLLDYNSPFDEKDNFGWTPLFEAIYYQDSKNAERLIQQGAKTTTTSLHPKYHISAGVSIEMLSRDHLPEFRKKYNKLFSESVFKRWQSPEQMLYQAIIDGNYNDAIQLIKSGIEINSEGNNSLLHAAVNLQHISFIHLLLLYGAPLEAKNKEGKTPLLAAIAQKADLEIIIALLRAGANVNAIDNHGKTCLHYCAKYIDQTYLNIAKSLIQRGADIHAGQFTPLHEAAYHENIWMIDLLLNNHASAYQPDDSGMLPIYYALKNGYENVYNLLKPISGYLSPTIFLEAAIEGNNFMAVKHFAHILKNLDFTFANGETPLLTAIRLKRKLITRLLINMGANINLKSVCEYENTPLHYSILYNNPSAFQLLIENKVNIEYENAEKISPLWLALSLQLTFYVEQLIKLGANINDKNMEGIAPIHFAILSNNIEMFNLLLNLGCDIHERTSLPFIYNDYFFPVHTTAIEWTKILGFDHLFSNKAFNVA